MSFEKQKKNVGWKEVNKDKALKFFIIFQILFV